MRVPHLSIVPDVSSFLVCGVLVVCFRQSACAVAACAVAVVVFVAFLAPGAAAVVFYYRVYTHTQGRERGRAVDVVTTKVQGRRDRKGRIRNGDKTT